ncbi:methyltransferase domain-containing protein [Tsuneonella flava]|uniref:Methyltransferase domain-containing protein n=1 Tax=Tsuneonella flava TaxID=2055955 RepID=A0ABX7K7F0_9SPHN|nr:class I SAM-dependent methyltransferase [Tsuneonella flava]QSB44184.1 methyltransferase domain-containing protein [Tsuneonella flava]
MASAQPHGGDHAALMDSVYRGQRHIYDLTRKYYLFGRDRLIDGLDCAPGDRVLEVACGTGRNLALIQRRWPGVRLHGFDISGEMLKNASARLPRHVQLAQGDACHFTPMALFGQDGFERVIISYSLSMIPDWQGALAQAVAALSPTGSLHVVDFGSLERMPAIAAAGLRGWLKRFHVAPREELPEVAQAIAQRNGLECTIGDGPLGYYRTVRLQPR